MSAFMLMMMAGCVRVILQRPFGKSRKGHARVHIDTADDADDQSAHDPDDAENNSVTDGEGNPPGTDTSDTGTPGAQDTDGSDGQASDTGTPITPVAPLLEGYVPEETRLAVAKTLTEGARGKTGDALRTFVRETLISAAPAASEAELAVLTELVAAYLASLTGA